MSDLSTIWLILAAAAATYVTRIGGYVLITRMRTLPPRLEQALNAVPAAVLTTLWAPAFFTGSWDIRVTLIVAALVCFSFDWLSSDVVALGLLLALILSGLLSPADAFAGFGSETVIMILGLLIMTSALIKTGVVALAGQAVLRAAGSSPDRVLAFMMVGCAALSAFISNTAAAAFFLPIVIAVAAKSKTSPSRFLMPVAFASILTSSVTLISTSTNLVISGLMTRAGLSPIGFFELTPVGLPIAAVGLAYTFFIGRHLVRSRAPSQGLLDQFGLRSYVTDVVVLPSSRGPEKPWANSASRAASSSPFSASSATRRGIFFRSGR